MIENLALLLIFLSIFWLAVTLLRVAWELPQRRKLRQRLKEIDSEGIDEESMEALLKRPRRDSQELFPGLDQLTERWERFMAQAGLKWNPSTLLALAFLCALAGLVVGLLVGVPYLTVPICGAFGLAAPFFWVAYKRRQRFNKFEEIFPEAMGMLARAVRAGYAFSSALHLLGKEMPEPVAGEFRKTFEQQNLGMPLEEALDNLTRRVPLPDVRVFVALLNIQLESGGNLAEMLDNLSEVVRERFKLLRQVQVFTAEGRMSMYVLTALPPVSAVLFAYSSPDYMNRLFTDPLGHQMIAMAVILQIVGYLVIRRIIKIEV